MIVTIKTINYRLGYNITWESSWVDIERTYRAYLHQDFLVLREKEIGIRKIKRRSYNLYRKYYKYLKEQRVLRNLNNRNFVK